MTYDGLFRALREGDGPWLVNSSPHICLLCGKPHENCCVDRKHCNEPTEWR